jgi:hypothetical protein
MLRLASLTVLGLIVAGAAPRAQDAPRVAKAVPDDGAVDVDPATRELRVTFDQDMDQGGMSIVGGGPTFPADPKQRPRWVDARTIVLPLALEPGKEYQLSINSSRFRNFRSSQGVQAAPYPIRFKTADRSGATPKKLDAEANRAAVERLRQAIDDDYSYRDRLHVDWGRAFREAAPDLLATETPLAFAKRAAALVASAEDLHFWFRVGDWQVPSFDRPVTPNFDRAALAKAVPGIDPQSPVAVGRVGDGVTYVLIASWSKEVGPRLGPVFEAIAQADPKRGIILDVRPNGGGDESLARTVAGCFLDGPKVYSKYVTRSNGTTSPPRDRTIEPDPARPHYSGPVAVLIGPATMSSCESFVLMMKQAPRCKLVGAPTRGSSGNPRPVDLGNGVVAWVPSWQDLDADGRLIEGQGVPPDVEVKAGPADFRAGDPVLRRALETLRGR